MYLASTIDILHPVFHFFLSHLHNSNMGKIFTSILHRCGDPKGLNNMPILPHQWQSSVQLFRINSMILQSHKTQSLPPILNWSINVKTKESKDRERELLGIPIIVQHFTQWNNLVHPVTEVPLFFFFRISSCRLLLPFYSLDPWAGYSHLFCILLAQWLPLVSICLVHLFLLHHLLTGIYCCLDFSPNAASFIFATYPIIDLNEITVMIHHL